MSDKVKTTSILLKSEFWVTIVTSISGLLLAFGVITSDQAETISKYTPNIIGALMTLVSTLKFVGLEHEAKVEVFRAMCAAHIDNSGQFKAQGVDTPEKQVSELAKAVGL